MLFCLHRGNGKCVNIPDSQLNGEQLAYFVSHTVTSWCGFVFFLFFFFFEITASIIKIFVWTGLLNLHALIQWQINLPDMFLQSWVVVSNFAELTNSPEF